MDGFDPNKSVKRCVWCYKVITDGDVYNVSGSIIRPSKIGFINELRKQDFTLCSDCFCGVYLGLNRLNSRIVRGIVYGTRIFLKYVLGPVFLGSAFSVLFIAEIFGVHGTDVIKLLLGLVFLSIIPFSLILIYGGFLLIF